MITIIKKEIKISKELLSKIEWACAFSKTTPRIINRTKKINDFRKMLRWARITRMKKISMLRVNFSGTIGTLEDKDMNNYERNESSS